VPPLAQGLKTLSFEWTTKLFIEDNTHPIDDVRSLLAAGWGVAIFFSLILFWLGRDQKSPTGIPAHCEACRRPCERHKYQFAEQAAPVMIEGIQSLASGQAQKLKEGENGVLTAVIDRCSECQRAFFSLTVQAVWKDRILSRLLTKDQTAELDASLAEKAAGAATDEPNEAESAPELLSQLRRAAGDDALNFASVSADRTTWVCVCGHGNQLDQSKQFQNCDSCHRSRDNTLKKYSLSAIAGDDVHS